MYAYENFLQKALGHPNYSVWWNFLVLGTIVNVFVKLPNNLAVSQGSEAAGILVGTLIGTALFIAICSCIVNAGINQWKDS